MKCVVFAAAAVALAAAHPSSSSSEGSGEMMDMKGMKDMSPEQKKAMFMKIKGMAHQALTGCMKDVMSGEYKKKAMAEMQKKMKAMGLSDDDMDAIMGHMAQMAKMAKEKMMKMKDAKKGRPMMSRRMAAARRPAASMGMSSMGMSRMERMRMIHQERQMQKARMANKNMDPSAMQASAIRTLNGALDAVFKVMHECHCSKHPKGPDSPDAIAEGAEGMVEAAGGADALSAMDQADDDMPDADQVEAMANSGVVQGAAGEAMSPKMKVMMMLKKKMRMYKGAMCVLTEASKYAGVFAEAASLMMEHPKYTVELMCCMHSKKQMMMEAMGMKMGGRSSSSSSSSSEQEEEEAPASAGAA